jgi:protein-disulfide isomerase
VTFNRRLFLASGASLGVLTLAACSSETASPEPEAAVGAPEASTENAMASDTGVAMYDGSPVDPIAIEPIMNPNGLPDRPIGGVGARVILIEYASPTCPHCATFANNVYPAIKEKYVDTGLITFIIRPFIRNALDAAVFMLAEAAGSESYYSVIETFFERQEQWAFSSTPRDSIEELALQLGFTQETFEAALTNQSLYEGMNSVREQALEEFDLTGTPTFYVNGEKLAGEQSIEEMSAKIDFLLG